MSRETSVPDQCSVQFCEKPKEVTIRLQPVCPFLREGPRGSAGVREVWP